MFTAIEKRKCIAREIALRERVYPKRVAEGKMKQEAADRELALMRAIHADYHAAEIIEQIAIDAGSRIGLP